MRRMVRIALLANPGSGSGDAGSVAEVLRSHGAELRRFGLDQADEAIAARPERLVVAGGDGSIGPGADAASRAGVPMAVVPVGTANDFARAMGIPADVAEAARIAARGMSTRRLELGRMGARPFVNVASLGLAPVAARKARGLKRALGPAAYALGAVRAGATADPVPCAVRCDGEELFAGDAWQVTVACSGAFGGGAELETDPQDGLLDVVAIEAGSRLALARRAYGLRRGTIGTQERVRIRRCAGVEVEVPAGTPFNVDGEVVRSGPVAFSVQEAAVELVVG
jgi:diacylglycerol kinase (ATP)